MTLETIKSKVDIALNEFYALDMHLLRNDIHERTLGSVLARYLQAHFVDFEVDCEYDGNVEHESGRKKVNGSKVYPDIIIHKRGNNANNLLVIELKKSTNREDRRKDASKLINYTSQECNFQYDFGLFLELFTGSIILPPLQDWYYDGAIMQQ